MIELSGFLSFFPSRDACVFREFAELRDSGSSCEAREKAARRVERGSRRSKGERLKADERVETCVADLSIIPSS